ncbi:MAG: DUF2335 domain-containing protein [Chloroflexota bacterium]|jgi:uncharacterized membrane protein
MTDDDLTSDALENNGQGPEANSRNVSQKTHQDHSGDDTPGNISEITEALRSEAPQALQLLGARIEEHFQGPLPHPAILKGYEDILPGSANRIITMTEKQQQHRMELEHAVIHSDILMERLGLAVYFVLAMILVVGGIWLASEGKQLTGLAVVGASITTLAGALVYAQRQRRQELQERRKSLKRPLPSNHDIVEKAK